MGKTATAECVADLVQRPLYPLTCGDLGSNAKEIEDSLSFHLYSASRWDCVMLLGTYIRGLHAGMLCLWLLLGIKATGTYSDF